MSLKTDALMAAQDLAATLSARLSGVYDGPLVVAGGWVRDKALGFTPKDLDVFIDGGICTSLEMADTLANRINTATLQVKPRQFSSYGTWASDVDHITQVHDHPKGPVDLVVLRRDALEAAGYTPQSDVRIYRNTTFLHAVLSRIDLRVNAIGANAYQSHCAPMWDFDVAAKRLVIQASRKDENMDREDKRLARLLGGKFFGWSVYHEEGDTLMPYMTGDAHDQC